VYCQVPPFSFNSFILPAPSLHEVCNSAVDGRKTRLFPHLP
jgi:hypothetical protein